MRAALAVLCLVCLSHSAHGYTPPRRTETQVAQAIGYSRPGLPLALRRAWASALLRVAAQHRFDALTGWAIIHHESRWRPDAVSSDGQDVGLGQIRWRLRRGCRDDPESAECRAERRRLLDPAANMAVMGHAITAWRTLCKKTGKADLRHWLAGYGGYSRPPKTLCGRTKSRSGWRDLPIPKPVQDIMHLRLRMIRRLGRPR